MSMLPIIRVSDRAVVALPFLGLGVILQLPGGGGGDIAIDPVISVNWFYGRYVAAFIFSPFQFSPHFFTVGVEYSSLRFDPQSPSSNHFFHTFHNWVPAQLPCAAVGCQSGSSLVVNSAGFFGLPHAPNVCVPHNVFRSTS